uniref:Uncharacterized protein n=1 Tax=Cannabis sativa TaxID=3483 RepID=A0A803QSH1_CANSA
MWDACWNLWPRPWPQVAKLVNHDAIPASAWPWGRLSMVSPFRDPATMGGFMGFTATMGIVSLGWATYAWNLDSCHFLGRVLRSSKPLGPRAPAAKAKAPSCSQPLFNHS